MACPTSQLLRAHCQPESSASPVVFEDYAAPSGVYQWAGKRALDLTLVVSVLPIALCIAAPIATWNLIAFRDPRRIFFVQDRVGYRGRRFQMIKFRTMRDTRKSAADSWFSGGDAARVTRFGRFLRNMHLDELPQLLNILKGDMHLVGPRPEMPDVHDWACTEIPEFPRRLAVRPGLTGLAQVTQGYTGASTECYQRKLNIDLGYIARLSLRTDLGIVGRTIPWVLQGKGWSWKKGSTVRSDSTRRAQPLVEADSIPSARPAGPIEGVPEQIERVRAKADAA